MSSLSCSKNVELAEKFLDFAASYDIQGILIKYGLSD
jgi:ABC-type thiamine transport system substrate-binding protein